MSWISAKLKILRGIGFSLICAAVILEIIFRCLPVSDSLMVKPVNTENPVLKFTENREVTRQIGFNFQHVTQKSINNEGYASDKNFQKKTDEQTKAVIAVIGDSFVEALQVENKNTFHHVLDKNLKGYDVYPIGISGSQLPTYIAFATYAAETFNPKLFVFTIISNDFDQSFFRVKEREGFHYFKTNGGSYLVNYEPSFMARLERYSAFLRYLSQDLKVTHQFQRILGTRASTIENKNERNDVVEMGEIANRVFIENLLEIKSKSPIILMMDADREAIYAGKKYRDFDKPENILFRNLATLAEPYPNIHILDLHSTFVNDYITNNKKFEYDYDLHWNEHGHSTAGHALAKAIQEIGL